MLRNKLLLMLCLCLLSGSAVAESPSIISQEMIKTETVNYSKTAVAQRGEYRRDYSANASVYYPHTRTLSVEVDNANFLEYNVVRSQHVQKGQILATFTLDVDEAAITSARLALESAKKSYEIELAERQKALEDMIKAQQEVRDPYERELSALRIRRETVALEQYVYQQDCNIQNLKRKLDELEKENSQSYLLSPFDGIVDSAVYKRVGEKVYANEELGSIYREEGMLIKISNENLYFRYGMPVTVTSGNKKDQKVFHGTVVAADDLLPESRRQGIAYIQLHDLPADERLVRLTVSGTSEALDDVIIIPRRAATMEAGNYYVERLVNGALQKRFINVGLNTMSDLWVVQGLEVGDTIVID